MLERGSLPIREQILRAPDTDGGGGSGARLPEAGFIFKRVAANGKVPPDAGDVEEALDELGSLYGKLGVDKRDARKIVDGLSEGFDSFEDGDLPVDFLREGGFHGGNRTTQVKAGEHIMTVYKAIKEAVDELG